MKKQVKIGLGAAALALAAALCAGGTLAGWRTSSTVTNHISTATVQGIVEEKYEQGQTITPGQTVEKCVWVKNTGTASSLVRAKVVIDWDDETAADMDATALAEQRVERALSVTVSQPEPRLAQEDNTETGAWITVPGTNIDAPVQQASDNDYYLRRDTAGNADVHGCVFADYACDLNSTSLSRNLVLYGHTFEDGYEGGFKALHNYEQDSFAEEHPYIYLSLPDAALTYRVVSAGVCSAADDRDCIEPNPDDAAFAQILAKAAARNTLDNGETLNLTDHILTLSTCTGESDTRYLVVAKLVDAVKK